MSVINWNSLKEQVADLLLVECLNQWECLLETHSLSENAIVVLLANKNKSSSFVLDPLWGL